MFRGWVSSIGKAVTAKDVITRTVKVTNVGRPSMAEDRSTVTAATGMTVTPASSSVVKGQSTTLTVAFQPEAQLTRASVRCQRIKQSHRVGQWYDHHRERCCCR